MLFRIITRYRNWVIGKRDLTELYFYTFLIMFVNINETFFPLIQTNRLTMEQSYDLCPVSEDSWSYTFL